MTTPDARPVSDERLAERMACEKLQSAIAWFEGDEKPNRRRVTCGDILSMLRELQSLRAAVERLTSDRDAQSKRMWELGHECDALRARIASLKALMRSAPRRSCPQSCSAYWGSPSDCHCGAVAWNAAIDAAMKEGG